MDSYVSKTQNIVKASREPLKERVQSHSGADNFNHSQSVTYVTLIILAILTVVGFMTFDYKDIDFFAAFIHMLKDLRTMFLNVRLSHFTLAEGLYQTLITIGLAYLTTVCGAVIALFFGLLAAQNLTNGKVSNVIKGFVALIRAVPTVLWVLIFAVSAGLGSVAAVIGMSFHSVGYLIKAYSESFEEMDNGIIEALKASGAGWWQIVFQAVLPSTFTSILAWTYIRFEVNFTNAVAMGAAAGAGGIGFELFMSNSFYFDLREVGGITYLILAVAMIFEILSNQIKKKFFIV